jgi:putative ABC transport system permease protein
VLVAQLGSWAVCRYFLGIGYLPYWPACLVLLAATVGLVVVLGLLSSITIIRKKPARFLREQV